MFNTFNRKRTVPHQAMITYIYAFLFQSQLILRAFHFDTKTLYSLSHSDSNFFGCCAMKIKHFAETVSFPQEFLCAVSMCLIPQQSKIKKKILCTKHIHESRDQ